jgi:outer membrane protein OmpA-like peptidoglycan-associated protein
MRTRLRAKPIGLAILSAALCFGPAAYAQDANNAANAQNAGNAAAKGGGSGADEHPDLVEIDPFGGISLWGQVQRGLDTKLVDGGVAGIRAAYNPTQWVGLEFFYAWDRANVEFKTPSGTFPDGSPLPTYSFGAYIHQWAFNPIFNLRPRGSRVQPYLTVGIGGEQFTPTSTAKSQARSDTNNTLYQSAGLNDNLQVALNYGGGVKFHLSDHFGLRFDARGFFSRNPTYGLANFPNGGIYIPSKDKLNGLEATAGLVFYLGQKKCPPLPPPPPPPAPLTQGAITGAEGQTICQGKPVNLHSTASGPAGHTLTYAWKLNGQPSGSNSADFSFTPNNTGDFQVEVTVTDTTPPPPAPERPKDIPVRCWVQPPAPQPPAPVTATTTLTVSDAAPQISNVTATPATLSCAADKNGTHTATLAATASASACGGNLSYKWTVSEGSVSNDTSANATFDASTLNFEGGAQNQTKTVTATVTVTTETGRTASQSTQITVNCPPQFVRLSDVVFAKNNARVNNCGKRVLIDDAAPRLASGDYDIVVVGHRDNDEKETVAAPRRGRRAAPANSLDQQRALNAAAVLSGGTATCAKVDPSRIKIDWVGTDQTSDTNPALCGTSNLPEQKERKGSKVTEADKNRRVEVYLVPHGSSSMPPAVKNPRELPADQMKLLGCPK